MKRLKQHWSKLPVGIALLLAACSSGTGDKSTAGTVLRVGDQQLNLQTLLKAAGEDSAQGVEWSNFIGGPAIIAAETGGSVIMIGSTSGTRPSPGTS